jgi:hypothetical protein
VLHHRGDGTTKERTLLKAPEEWEKTGKISFPEPLQGDGFTGVGRVRGSLRGGISVAFPPTDNGMRGFLAWVNRNWKATITKVQRDARPAHFKKVFTDSFPYTLDKPFRNKPRYYIVYNTRTKNVRVREIDFSQPSDDDFMALQFGVPIHRRDYNDFFKDSLAPPTQEFAEVLQNAPAPAPAEGQGRVRGGWIPTNIELVQMPTEEIEQIADDDDEFNYLIAQQQFLRTGVNRPKPPRKKRAPRGNACADTSIRRRKPPPPPPPPPSFTANGRPKSFAKAMKELMAKQ